MKKKLPTLSIGITAFNEEKNIENLLLRLSELKTRHLNLEKIFIVSDGSTDGTVDRALRSKNKAIIVKPHIKRKGKGIRLYEICKIAQSDFLLILDADIIIKDPLFIDKITDPLINGGVALTSCKVTEIISDSYIAKILTESMNFKRKIFLGINNGDNIYTCHGRARAFTKSLYKKLDFRKYTADDAYSYLFTKKNNFGYEYVSKTEIFYKIPETISDHLKQSTRFFSTQKEFNKEFGAASVSSYYKIPFQKITKCILASLIRNPFQIVAYVAITILSIVSSQRTKASWGTAYSTK